MYVYIYLTPESFQFEHSLDFYISHQLITDTHTHTHTHLLTHSLTHSLCFSVHVLISIIVLYYMPNYDLEYEENRCRKTCFLLPRLGKFLIIYFCPNFILKTDCAARSNRSRGIGSKKCNQWTTASKKRHPYCKSDSSCQSYANK